MLNSFSGDSFASPSPVVNIEGVELTPIEIDGKRYLTFAQIDQVHQRPAGTASRNFRENRENFIEGEDFNPTKFVELQKSGVLNPSPNGAILITETGYSMLVKSFTDKLSWKVQRQLVNGYFRKTTPVVDLKDPLVAIEMLIEAKREILAERAQVKALQGEKAQLTAAVVEMLPDQAFCNAVRASREDLLPTVFAKEIRDALSMNIKEIIERMIQEGMLFRRGKNGKLLPKESKKYEGWFRVKKNERWDASAGEYVPCDQTLVTGLGQQQIFKKWNIPEPARLFALAAAQ